MLNKIILKTSGKNSQEYQYAFINSKDFNGVDEWHKVEINTELRMFDSDGSDSSKFIFVDNNGIKLDTNADLLEKINKLFRFKSPLNKDKNLSLFTEPNTKSKKLFLIRNKDYFKLTQPLQQQMFQGWFDGVKQDWNKQFGITDIIIK